MHVYQNIITVSQSSLHNYIVIKAVLFWHNNKTIICLDTESITIFVDWDLVDNETKIKYTSLLTAEDFSETQILN